MAITAKVVVDRIQQNIGVVWRDTPVDALLAGSPDDEVKGIVTSYAPSMEVLHKAVASGKNMIVSLENPFWTRPASLVPGGTSPQGDQVGPPGYRPISSQPRGGGLAPAAAGGAPAAPPRQATMDDDPVYQAKKEFIAKNNLIVYRFFDNWTERQPNPQLGALIKALGWEKNYKPTDTVPWATYHAAFLPIPPATLKATAQYIKKTLPMRSIRIIGEPETRVSKAAVTPGIALLVDLERYFSEPGVDLIVMGEAIWENEGMEYVTDIVAAGQQKGLILLGEEVSQEPGCGEMANWLKTFVHEVPVEWIPAGDPSWTPA